VQKYIRFRNIEKRRPYDKSVEATIQNGITWVVLFISALNHLPYI